MWQDERNRVEIIHNDQGNKTTPSFVAFTDDERLIGDAAKNQTANNPQNTVFDTYLMFFYFCVLNKCIYYYYYYFINVSFSFKFSDIYIEVNSCAHKLAYFRVSSRCYTLLDNS